MQANWKRLVCLVLCMAMVLPMVPQIRVQAAETADAAVQAAEDPRALSAREMRPLEVEQLYEKEKFLQSGMIEIGTKEEFLAIMGDDYEDFYAYRLTADIDLGEIVPLGYDPETGTTTPFNGFLYGDGYTLSYSMKEVPGCASYGLFAYGGHAIFEKIDLDVKMNLTLTDTASYYVGAVVGNVQDSSLNMELIGLSLTEVSVSGFVKIDTEVNGGKLATGIMSGANWPVDTCEADINVDIHSAGTMEVCYQGLYGFNCVISGDVSLYGNLVNTSLLYYAEDSICMQNLTVSNTGISNVCLANGGFNNSLSGQITVYPTHYGGKFTLLRSSDNSSFCGDLSIIGESTWGAFVACGAWKCSNTELDVNIEVFGNSGCHIYGLESCTDSVFDGSMRNYGCNSTEMIGATGGEGNQVLAQFEVTDTRSPMISVLKKETNSLYEGDVRVSTSVKDVDSALVSECTNCMFDGDVICPGGAGTYGTLQATLRIAENGTDNLIIADIEWGRSVAPLFVLSGETGSYFKGSVSGWGNVVVVDGEDCYAEADVSACECFLFSNTATNSYFTGQVQCESFTPFSLTASNCCAEADVKMEPSQGILSYDCIRWIDPSYEGWLYTLNTVGNNCSFTGSIDLTTRKQVDIKSTFPVSIHHGIVGEWSSLSCRSVGYHDYSGCTYGCPYLVPDVYNTLDPGHYSVAISVERPGEDSNSSSATDGWNGSIDPVDKTYQPDEGTASYIFRVVTPDEKPLSGGSLVFNGLRYFLNDGGVVTVKNGPGFISSLAVHSPEGTELKTYDCYRPIPDAINTLRVGDDLNLKPDLVAQGGTAAEEAEVTGIEMDVAGVKYPMLMMALGSNLDLQAWDLNIASSFNEDTKRYEVILSTEHLETARADSWKDTWKEYSRVLKEGKIKDEPSEKKKKFLGMECDWTVTAVMEFEYVSATGGFKIVSGTGRLKFGGDARNTRPFAVPAFYWTVSRGAEIEGSAGMNSTYDEVVKAAVVRFMGAVDVAGFLEGALGVGVRPANIYAEAGLNGTLAGGVEFPWVSLRDSLHLNLTGDVFLEERAWVLGGRQSKELINWQIWPRPAKGMDTLSIPQNTEMKLLPRNYANQAVTMAQSSTGGFASVIDDNRADYPYSYLRLVQLSDGRYLLVYTDDDTTRAAGDRSILRAVIGTVDDSTNRISWGESVTIDGDGTGDYSVNVSVSGTEVALIWQDMDKTFGEGGSLTAAEMAEHVELSLAILDCSGAVPAVTESRAVTDGNGLCEEHASVCNWGSEIRSAWVTSTINDPTVTQDSEIYTVWLNGEQVAETRQIITGIVLLEEELLWSTQTENGSDLWMLDAEGTVTQLRTEGIKDLQNRGEYFCFTEGTGLYRGKGSYDTLTEIDRNEAYTNTVRISDDGQLYILDNKTDRARLYAFRDGAQRPVADFDGFISCWDISGGQAAVLVKHGFGTEETSDDAAYLRSTPEQTIVDIQVGELYCENTAAAPGSQVTMSATVFNNGTNDLSQIAVQLTGSSGAVLSSGNLSVNIPAGESAVAEFSFTVPENFTSQDVTVIIAGTAQTVYLGKSNLKVEAIWKKYRPEQMQVKVTNTGLGAATGTVTISDGTGTLLTQDVTIPQGEQQLLEVAFDHLYLNPTAIHVTLTEAETAAVSYDNEDFVTVIYDPMETSILVFDDQTLIAGDRVSIQCRPVPAETAVPDLTYIVDDPEVISVDAQGNLTALKVGTATVTAITEQGKTAKFTVNVLDIFPMKESRTLTIQSWETANYIFIPEADGRYALYLNDKDSALSFYIVSPNGYSSSVNSENRQGEAMDMKAGERYEIWISNYSEEAVTGTFIMDNYTGTIQQHSYISKVTAPTCTEKGYTTYTCNHCGDSYVDDYRDALNHSWGKWEVIRAATADKDGEKMRQCSRCQEQEKKSIPATGGSPEETKPSEPEDTKPTEPDDTKPTEPKYDNPFEDVFEADYYYDPVLWAVNRGITNGMDATHFAPEGTCTRAQIVTFLWRANGSPASGGTNPFTDVPADAWYTNAVLWAVENGITTGTSATTFSPDAGCTRGQVATFLWRSQGQPSVNGENIFTDIAYGAYYYDAVLWAVANGITNGMGEGLFAPDATCTRGQIVTFLYRAME